MKSVQLEDYEIEDLIKKYGQRLHEGTGNISQSIDRLRYLTKRLKAPVSDAEENKGF